MKSENQNQELFWAKFVGIITGIMSLCALLILMSEPAFSDTEQNKKGFLPGDRPFTNPFANAKPILNKPAPSALQKKPKTIQVGGQTDPKDVPSPKKNSNGIAVGGEPSGGVISNQNFKPLYVDIDSGEGSKEIVTDFNYPDADILDVAKTIGKLTGKNFIFDKNVKGRISIVSNSPITVSDAWKAFLTALDINAFALIPSGKYIRIARQRDARDKQLSTFTGKYSPESDQLITRIFPLKYIEAQEVHRTLRGFMPANSRVVAYPQTNTLIVTDTGANVQKLAKMLTFLDVEGFDAGIDVITVKHASATELAKLIDALIPGTAGATNTSRTRRSAPALSSFAARKTKGGGVINTIIADERTNSLIVHANEKGVQEVVDLVTKLDKKIPAATGGGRIHVIYLQFADAEEVAKTLNNLTQSASKSTSPIKGKGTGVNPIQATLFQGDIRVSPDKSTNSLVVTASPGDFVTVQRVISKLDIPRDQVYVEAVIMEVSLGKQFELATNIASPTSGIGFTPNTDLLEFIKNPIAQRGLVLGFAGGATQNITVNGESIAVNSVMGLIKAIQTNSQANVLATPQIMTLDNTEATFETQEKIPVPQSTVNQGVVSNSIGSENISLSLKIKPQINKVSNYVKLDILSKMDDISNRAVPASLQSSAIGVFSRKAETSVVVADGDTVVIGGLVRDKTQETVSKIPVLGDIPLLGWLFRAKREEVDKTNLLIFLTPHIVRQYEKVRAILDKKLQERDEFIQKSTGGQDPLRYKRDEMIRSLPEMSKVLNYESQTSYEIDNKKVEAPIEETTFGGSLNEVPEFNEDETLEFETDPPADPIPVPDDVLPPLEQQNEE